MVTLSDSVLGVGEGKGERSREGRKEKGREKGEAGMLPSDSSLKWLRARH